MKEEEGRGGGGGPRAGFGEEGFKEDAEDSVAGQGVEGGSDCVVEMAEAIGSCMWFSSVLLLLLIIGDVGEV